MAATPTAAAMLALFGSCRDHGLFGLIVGESGAGKTTAAMSFADGHDGAVYCRMSRAASRMGAGLRAIARSLIPWGAADGSAENAYRLILTELAKQAAPVLILDEAQHMADDLVDAVRDLYDEAGTGLVLIANAGLTERWTAPRAARRGNYDQVLGRIGPRLMLGGPHEADVSAIARHHGIESARELGIVQAAAALPGGLHNVAGLLGAARAFQPEGAPTRHTLQKAARIAGTEASQ